MAETILLPIGGGTGVKNPTAHNILVGAGASPVTLIAPGTSGQILTSNGSSADPTFQAAPSGFTAGGDLSGTSTSQTVIGLDGKALDSSVGSPTDRQVVQYDSASGKWKAVSQPFDVLFNPNVVMGSGTIYDVAVFVRTVVFPGNFSGSAGHCRVNPGTTQTINVNKNGSQVGTISITSSGVFSFTTTSGATVTYNSGDYMSFTNQAGADTGMLLQVTLTGTR
jgi:hypothetical protein